MFTEYSLQQGVLGNIIYIDLNTSDGRTGIVILRKL